MSTNPLGWHVLYVKHQHEKKIDLYLKESNLNTFLPMVTTIREWSDRKKKIQKPLFPSYIFVDIASQKDFYMALSVEGVFKYIRFGNEYAKVSAEEINKIRRLVNLDGVTEIDTINRIPKIGQAMKINYGPLSGLNCEVVKLNNKNKIIVRLDSINQCIVASVPAVYLTPSVKIE